MWDSLATGAALPQSQVVRTTPCATAATPLAATDKELIDAAVQHAVAVHGEKDTQEFRKQIAGAMHEGTPPLQAKATA